MNNNRKIEIFSAGCSVCQETIRLVNSFAGSSCEIEILDMHKEDVAAKAERYGVRSVPAVVIDGKLADCCMGRGVDEETLKEEGVSVSLS
jgi:glutaredoxin 3